MEFCDSLMEQNDSHKIKHNSETTSCQHISQIDDMVNINRQDVENLSNFVQIWTDVIDIEIVMKQFKTSEFTDLKEFERINHLYNVGFFYVSVNPHLSVMEFYGLLHKIPWENLCLDGMSQIPYSSIAQLFEHNSNKVAIQLMVLGDFLKFWILINPFNQMKKTSEPTKLLLSGMGNLSIYISINFLKNCQELIETIDLPF